MIRFRALGIRFSLPLLAMIMPLLAMRLGMRAAILPLMLALGVHELAHLFAARLMHVQITEIRLMPFGGSARMENPYGLTPAQLIVTAAAGPLANFLCALLIAAATQWRLLVPAQAAEFFQPHLILMLFNLTPALPLDGGRILYAALLRPMGEKRALHACLYLGHVLAAALFAAAIWGGLHYGKWNLTLILSGVFILASQRDESRALGISRSMRLEAALDADAQPQLARFYQLDASTSAQAAVKLLRPREREWFLLTDAGEPAGVIDGRSIVRFLVGGGHPETPLSQLNTFELPLARRDRTVPVK